MNSVACHGPADRSPNRASQVPISPASGPSRARVMCGVKRLVSRPRPAASQAASILRRSPLHKASAIRRPLLIGQGANDPRVKQSESDQIVEAMKAHGIPVTYVVFPDEGHGFAKPTNRIAFNAITENFLATVLGGRAEPITSEVEGSSAQILAGAELL